MNRLRFTNAARQGVTLTELLIVMLVMLMITAIAIPTIAPAMQNREVREAARMIDAFINGARSRALQAGHPYGIMLERELGNPNAVSTLSYVEQPDAWQGDYGQSTAGSGSTVLLLGNGGFGAWSVPPVSVDQSAPVFPMGDVGWQNNIAPGDIMTIKGVQYRIYAGEPFIDLDGNGYWTAASGQMPNEPYLDVDGNGNYTQPLPASGQSTIDFSTGYFNQVPTPFQYGSTGAYMTYAPADPLAAAAIMNSTGHDLVTGGPILFGPFLSGAIASHDTSGPNTAFTTGFQFAINRRPVKTAAGSIQLPGDAVIDLGANYPDQQYSIVVPIPGSGLEVIQSQQNATGYWSTFRANPSLDPAVPGSLAAADATMADRSSVMITFQPNGTVDQVYSWSESGMNYSQGSGAWQTTTVNWTNWQGRIPISTIYILVGRRDLINGDPNLIANIAAGTAPLKPIYSVQDPSALWIAINPRNGQVATAENVGFDLTQPIPVNAGMTGQNAMQMQIYFAANVYYSRRLAREQLDMGGR